MAGKDLSPIDQRWVQQYVDKMLEYSGKLTPGPMQDALLRRVECVMDLVEAWQNRNNPRSYETKTT